MNNYSNERGVRNNMTHNSVQPVGGPSYGESPASGPAPTTAGHHKHDILNKLDPRVDSTKDNRPIANQHGGNNVPEGTYGPHSSRIANALDPRVDSDADRNRGPGGMGSSNTHTMHGATGPGMHSTHNNNNVPEGSYGPHSSRMANALDPRVDSDADRNRMAPGGAGMGHHTHDNVAGGHGAGSGAVYGNTAGAGYGNNNSMMGSSGTKKTAGPHKSDLLNKLDPRVDSKTGEVAGSYGGGVQGANTGPVAGGRY
ncbi:hypothetical protein V8F33_010857 [Rhypophila sp. PSN 637]